MSKDRVQDQDSFWTNPAVERAVENLKAALGKALRLPEASKNNLMISMVTEADEMQIFYEGCDCPKCATATIQAVSQNVFGIRSEVVRAPFAMGNGPKVH